MASAMAAIMRCVPLAQTDALKVSLPRYKPQCINPAVSAAGMLGGCRFFSQHGDVGRATGGAGFRWRQ
jgi:hypothetical protein